MITEVKLSLSILLLHNLDNMSLQNEKKKALDYCSVVQRVSIVRSRKLMHWITKWNSPNTYCVYIFLRMRYSFNQIL